MLYGLSKKREIIKCFDERRCFWCYVLVGFTCNCMVLNNIWGINCVSCLVSEEFVEIKIRIFISIVIRVNWSFIVSCF